MCQGKNSRLSLVLIQLTGDEKEQNETKNSQGEKNIPPNCREKNNNVNSFLVRGEIIFSEYLFYFSRILAVGCGNETRRTIISTSCLSHIRTKRHHLHTGKSNT